MAEELNKPATFMWNGRRYKMSDVYDLDRMYRSEYNSNLRRRVDAGATNNAIDDLIAGLGDNSITSGKGTSFQASWSSQDKMNEDISKGIRTNVDKKNKDYYGFAAYYMNHYILPKLQEYQEPAAEPEKTGLAKQLDRTGEYNAENHPNGLLAYTDWKTYQGALGNMWKGLQAYDPELFTEGSEMGQRVGRILSTQDYGEGIAQDLLDISKIGMQYTPKAPATQDTETQDPITPGIKDGEEEIDHGAINHGAINHYDRLQRNDVYSSVYQRAVEVFSSTGKDSTLKELYALLDNFTPNALGETPFPYNNRNIRYDQALPAIGYLLHNHYRDKLGDAHQGDDNAFTIKGQKNTLHYDKDYGYWLTANDNTPSHKKGGILKADEGAKATATNGSPLTVNADLFNEWEKSENWADVLQQLSPYIKWDPTFTQSSLDDKENFLRLTEPSQVTDTIASGNNHYDPQGVAGRPLKREEVKTMEATPRYQFHLTALGTDEKYAENFARQYADSVGKTSDVWKSWFKEGDPKGDFIYDAFQNTLATTPNLTADSLNGKGHDTGVGSFNYAKVGNLIQLLDDTSDYEKVEDSKGINYGNLTGVEWTRKAIEPAITTEAPTAETSAENPDASKESGATKSFGEGNSPLRKDKGWLNLTSLIPVGYDTSALGWTLSANKRNWRDVEKGWKPYLEQPVQHFMPVTGAYSQNQYMRNQGNNYMSQMNQNRTSDSSLNLASMLDANKVRMDYFSKGFQADDLERKRTAEEAHKLQMQNAENRNQVANRNRQSINQNQKELITAKNTMRTNNAQSYNIWANQRSTNWANYLAEQRYYRREAQEAAERAKYNNAIANLQSKYKAIHNGNINDVLNDEDFIRERRDLDNILTNNLLSMYYQPGKIRNNITGYRDYPY